MASEGAVIKTNMKVLVADDDLIARILHPKFLEKAGIESSKVATNGKEAIDIVRDSGLDYFDFILMDIDMPVINGIEATKKLRKMGVPSMIVGVSSHPPDMWQIRELLEGGLMDDYIEKPLTPDNILSIMKKINQGSTA